MKLTLTSGSVKLEIQCAEKRMSSIASLWRNVAVWRNDYAPEASTDSNAPVPHSEGVARLARIKAEVARL